MDYQEEEISENTPLGVQTNNMQESNTQEDPESTPQEYIQSEDPQIPNNLFSNGPKKGLWIALFISLFILIFLILFVVSIQHDATTISKNEIIQGDTAKAGENKSIKLKFGEEEHNIILNVLGINSVDLTIKSEPINAHILINETQFFDINGDGEKDLRIKLEEIKGGKAKLFIKRVDGNFCIPNWQCGAWGECLDRIQNRQCLDLNECGKNISIPKNQIFCLESSVNLSEFNGNGLLSCLENNATSCNSSAKCVGNLINSSDSLRCCVGDCISFQLSDSIYSISCDKEISAFKEASDNCTSFTMNCEEKTIFPALGLIREVNSIFELQGYLNGSCIFYYKYNNFSINYSNEKFQELLESGRSSEQINFEVNSLAEGFGSLYINKNITCYYPVNDLKSFLYKWEIGRATWNLDVLGKYECAGSLKENSSDN
jgi:hypothetical protein